MVDNHMQGRRPFMRILSIIALVLQTWVKSFTPINQKTWKARKKEGFEMLSQKDYTISDINVACIFQTKVRRDLVYTRRLS